MCSPMMTNLSLTPGMLGTAGLESPSFEMEFDKLLPLISLTLTSTQNIVPMDQSMAILFVYSHRGTKSMTSGFGSARITHECGAPVHF